MGRAHHFDRRVVGRAQQLDRRMVGEAHPTKLSISLQLSAVGRQLVAALELSGRIGDNHRHPAEVPEQKSVWTLD